MQICEVLGFPMQKLANRSVRCGLIKGLRCEAMPDNKAAYRPCVHFEEWKAHCMETELGVQRHWELVGEGIYEKTL